jgi:hypothetical protein
MSQTNSRHNHSNKCGQLYAFHGRLEMCQSVNLPICQLDMPGLLTYLYFGPFS